MLEQLTMGLSGEMKTKLDIAIDRLKAFEPQEGYYVAFSGGKDSQCVYHLCQMAGVKFDARYNVTSVDPPELIYFIRDHYPDVIFEYPRNKDGKRLTMWSLIEQRGMPPTRVQRYCCAELKEASGEGRVTVTGVRWAESPRRKAGHGVASILGKPKTTRKTADDLGVEYRVNKAGALVLNDDNDIARRMVEQCYRTRKTLVNPIVDWETEDVWHFLNDVVKVPHCNLYDEGFSRLGCIGCPMSNQAKAFNRWPKYKALYLKAFDRMLKRRAENGKSNISHADWSTPEKVMAWWMQEEGDDSICTPSLNTPAQNGGWRIGLLPECRHM